MIVISKRLFNKIHSRYVSYKKQDGTEVRAYTFLSSITENNNNIFIRQENEDKPLILNFFDLNVSSKLTAWETKKGEQPCNPQGKWIKQGRIEVKAGKLTSILPMDFRYDNPEYECVESRAKLLNRVNDLIVNACSDIQRNIRRIQISGDVSEVYEMSNTVESGNTLNSSCMRPYSDHGCNEFTYVYKRLNNIEIAYIITEYGLLEARAIIWHDCRIADTDVKLSFMDRIYSTPEVEQSFIKYAIDKGWAYREFSNKTIFWKNEEIDGIYVIVSDDYYHTVGDEGSPYMDTLNAVRWSSSHNSYILASWGSSDFELQNSNGTTAVRCYSCDDFVRNDDVQYFDGEPYCSNCFYNRFSYCSYCDEAYDTDDGIVTEDHAYFCCDRCAKERGYTQCHNCGQWHDDNFEAGHLIRFCSNNCARNKGYDECSHCGEWSDDTFTAGDNEYCCKSCAEADGWRICSYCSEWSNDTITIGNNEYCSEPCAEADGYGQCSWCNEWGDGNIGSDDKEFCSTGCAKKDGYEWNEEQGILVKIVEKE